MDADTPFAVDYRHETSLLDLQGAPFPTEPRSQLSCSLSLVLREAGKKVCPPIQIVKPAEGGGLEWHSRCQPDAAPLSGFEHGPHLKGDFRPNCAEENGTRSMKPFVADQGGGCSLEANGAASSKSTLQMPLPYLYVVSMPGQRILLLPSGVHSLVGRRHQSAVAARICRRCAWETPRCMAGGPGTNGDT